MSFWRRQFCRPQVLDPDSPLRQRLTRLRRLNRCYRDFLGIFLDAAEKEGGGFILDRQYIVSVGERAFRLGFEIVFHSNVLQPGIAPGSYAELDRLKADLRDLLAGKRRPLGELVTVDATDAAVYAGAFEAVLLHHRLHGGTRGEEPEDRLLTGVLREMGSPLFATAHPEAPAADRQTLCGIVQSVYTAALAQFVAGSFRPRQGIPVPAPGFSEGIRAVDLSAPPSGTEGEAAGETGTSDSSAWLLGGLAGGGDGQSAPEARDARGMLYRWEESAAALLLGAERMVLLDAVVAGGAEGNHVMVYGSAGATSGSGAALNGMVAEAVRLGLVAIRTAGAVAAWRERIPPASARETLTRAGQLARQMALGTETAGESAG